MTQSTQRSYLPSIVIDCNLPPHKVTPQHFFGFAAKVRSAGHLVGELWIEYRGERVRIYVSAWGRMKPPDHTISDVDTIDGLVRWTNDEGMRSPGVAFQCWTIAQSTLPEQASKAWGKLNGNVVLAMSDWASKHNPQPATPDGDT